MGFFQDLTTRLCVSLGYSGYSRVDENRARNLLANWLGKENGAIRRIQRYQRRHSEYRQAKAATLFAARFRSHIIQMQYRRKAAIRVPMLRRWLVPLLDDPTSSVPALALEIMWCALVILAVAVEILGSLEPFVGPDGTPGGCPHGADHWTLHVIDGDEHDDVAVVPCSAGDEGCAQCPPIGAAWYSWSMGACAVGFSIEYALRVLVVERGKRLDYVWQQQTLIDLATFLPWYIQLALQVPRRAELPHSCRCRSVSLSCSLTCIPVLLPCVEQMDPREGNTLWLRAYGLFRIYRLAALLSEMDTISIRPFLLPATVLPGSTAVLHMTRKESNRMVTTFARTIKTTLPSLYISMLISLIFATLFGSLIFYLEHGEWDPEQKLWIREDGLPTPFTSIPAAMYYYIVSFTTCGYGDMTPITSGGRAVASLGILVGFLPLAAPIATLSANFAAFERLEYEESSHAEELRISREQAKAREAAETESTREISIGRADSPGGSLPGDGADGEEGDTAEVGLAPQSDDVEFEKVQMRESLVEHLMQIREYQVSLRQMVEITDRLGSIISTSTDSVSDVAEVFEQSNLRDEPDSPSISRPKSPKDHEPSLSSLCWGTELDAVRHSAVQEARLATLGFESPRRSQLRRNSSSATCTSAGTFVGGAAPGTPSSSSPPIIKTSSPLRRSPLSCQAPGSPGSGETSPTLDEITLQARRKLMKSGKYKLEATPSGTHVPTCISPGKG